jgi:hypothetical protein
MQRLGMEQTSVQLQFLYGRLTKLIIKIKNDEFKSKR